MIFVAELAKLHNGDANKALEMIKKANEHGYDAIKMQYYELSDLNPEHENYERYKKCHINLEDMQSLKYAAKNLGMDFWCSAFSLESVSRLREFTDTIKVPSTFLSNEKFVYECIKHFPNIHISTGMHEASDVFKYMQAYKTLGKNKNIVFYHCTSLYPTPSELERLDRIPYFKMGGFSYHGVNANSVIYAAMSGANYIELHYNHERNSASYKPFHWNDIRCLKEQCIDAKKCVPNSILTMDECRNFQYYKNEFFGLKAC